jgi:hypothetical protein
VINGQPGSGWNSGSGSITPVPEPRVYGAILLGGSLLFLGWRRRRGRAAKSRGPAAAPTVPVVEVG